MSIRPEHAYIFLGGACTGKLVGVLPSIILSGVMLFAADSSMFTINNAINFKNVAIELFKNMTK